MRFPEKCALMLLACVLAMALVGCDEDEGSPVDMRLRDPYHAVVDGTYSLAGYPHVTNPPLPCLAAAVSDDEQTYVLIVDGGIACPIDTFEWNSSAFVDGDRMTVEGRVKEYMDLHGGTWLGIEVESIR